MNPVYYIISQELIMSSENKKLNLFYIWLRYFSALMGIAIILYILTHNMVSLVRHQSGVSLFFVYSLLVITLLVVKYSASLFHTQNRYKKPENAQWPSISIIIPAFNEGRAVYLTVLSILKAEYPKELVEIVIINDCSTDDTDAWINKVGETIRGKTVFDVNKVSVQYIKLKRNVGKKIAMAEGIKRSNNRFLVFIDSDSHLDENCLKELVVPFITNNQIGAVCGHARVWNKDQNRLTKIQEIRYLQSFRALKATESLLGFVSCCSGCASAYRRTAVLKVLDSWVNQSFLGRKCRAGDDRSLTNLILKSGYKTVYNQNAIAYTIVPSTLRGFMKQQLRWRRSSTRENLITLSFIWKRSPLTSIFITLNMLLPFLTLVVLIRAILMQGFLHHVSLINYVAAVSVFSLIFGCYYQVYYIQSRRWLSAALLSPYLSLMMLWQMPYAILTIRDNRWGTR